MRKHKSDLICPCDGGRYGERFNGTHVEGAHRWDLSDGQRQALATKGTNAEAAARYRAATWRRLGYSGPYRPKTVLTDAQWSARYHASRLTELQPPPFCLKHHSGSDYQVCRECKHYTLRSCRCHACRTASWVAAVASWNAALGVSDDYGH